MNSYIYIITDGDAFKVGVSDNPQKRLRALQTGASKKLYLLETFEVPKDEVYSLEKQCHEKLNTIYEKRGEWFHNAILFDIRIIVESIVDSKELNVLY